MTQIKHTPTPWHTSLHDNGRIAVRESNASNLVAIICTSDEASRQTTGGNPDQDAAFIVRACNAHDDLVAALEKIKKISGINYEQDEKLRANGARTLKRISDFCDAALAKAKEGAA